MIDFLVGKPRNGKSLRAMMYIWEELTLGCRFIITNLVLDLDVIQALLVKRGFSHVDARKRIRMLDDKETKNFWLYRAHGLVLQRPPDYDEKIGADVDYTPVFDQAARFEDEKAAGGKSQSHSVFYVIDEVHTHWRARGWSGTPRHVDFYNSQHGKMDDRVIFITQNTKLVDSNFPRLAQSFGYCCNHRLVKHGRFRGDNKFTMNVYPGPATTGKEPTLNNETYHLDLEIAECYDTSAGVGMPGGGKADAGFRVKGLPLWTVWAGLAAALVVLGGFFGFVVPRMTRGMVARGIQGQPVVAPKNVAPVDTPDFSKFTMEERIPPLKTVAEARSPDRDHMRVRGYVLKGGKANVVLSDGRTITERDGLDRISRNSVEIHGETLFLAEAKDRPAAQHVPLSAVPADSAADSSPALPPPPPDAESSWERHSDGVSRLKHSETLADAFKR